MYKDLMSVVEFLQIISSNNINIIKTLLIYNHFNYNSNK